MPWELSTAAAGQSAATASHNKSTECITSRVLLVPLAKQSLTYSTHPCLHAPPPITLMCWMPAGASSLLPKKQEASPEEAARDLERLVHELMEASAELVASGEAATGAAGAAAAAAGRGIVTCRVRAVPVPAARNSRALTLMQPHS